MVASDDEDVESTEQLQVARQLWLDNTTVEFLMTVALHISKHTHNIQ